MVVEAEFHGEDAALDCVERLISEEKELRRKIAYIRKQRADIKAQGNVSYPSSRPGWMEYLPEKFWLPVHVINRTVNDMTPNVAYTNIAPDLTDWSRGGGVKEFILNLIMMAGMAIMTWQLLFFIF